jgi:hypothetical protein
MTNEWDEREEGAYDLINIHTEEYVDPASDDDVAAYFWWKSKGRPWIVRRGFLCRVRKVNLYGHEEIE